MKKSRSSKHFPKNLPRLIGVIHLPPLPGSAGAAALRGSFEHAPASVLMNAAGEWAVKEAQVFSQMGFDGIILENFGDAPFEKNQIAPETFSALSIIAGAVRELYSGFLGINVLRNDARSAVAIASVIGAEIIRSNLWTGVAATDQGLIEGEAPLILKAQKTTHSSVSVFADVHVKHAVSLSTPSLTQAIEETVLRGKATAVILTGKTTGRAVSLNDLKEARDTTKRLKAPLYLGSGVTSENAGELKKLADGFIVSSDLRKNGRAGEALDLKRMKAFIKALKKSK